MNRFGQMSVEVIFVLVVMLWFISVLIIPGADLSIAAAQDVSGIAQLKSSVAKIENTIDNIALNKTDGWKDVYVFIPKGAMIGCYWDSANNVGEIVYQAPLNRTTHPACDLGVDNDGDAMMCTQRFRVNERVELDCDGFGEPISWLGPGLVRDGAIVAEADQGRYIWIRISKQAGVVYLDEQS